MASYTTTFPIYVENYDLSRPRTPKTVSSKALLKGFTNNLSLYSTYAFRSAFVRKDIDIETLKKAYPAIAAVERKAIVPLDLESLNNSVCVCSGSLIPTSHLLPHSDVSKGLKWWHRNIRAALRRNAWHKGCGLHGVDIYADCAYSQEMLEIFKNLYPFFREREIYGTKHISVAANYRILIDDPAFFSKVNKKYSHMFRFIVNSDTSASQALSANVSVALDARFAFKQSPDQLATFFKQGNNSTKNVCFFPYFYISADDPKVNAVITKVCKTYPNARIYIF